MSRCEAMCACERLEVQHDSSGFYTKMISVVSAADPGCEAVKTIARF